MIDRQKKRARDIRYRATEKGKAQRKRYEATEKAHERKRRYDRGDKGIRRNARKVPFGSFYLDLMTRIAKG